MKKKTEHFLFEEFPPVSAREWKEKIMADLKGEPYEKLITPTPEKIDIQPFYHLDFYEAPEAIKAPRHFSIAYTWENPGNQDFPEKLKNRKVDIIRLPWRQNIPVEILEPYKNLLHIVFRDTGISPARELVSRGFSLKIDPLGNALKGLHPLPAKENLKKWAEIPAEQSGLELEIDTGVYQNAGATITEQLAFGLYQATWYVENGFPPGKISFKTATGYHFFFEIAKLKALRFLWHKITGINPGNLRIFAEPSLRNKTLFDPYVNMLRTGMESMAAILGGANEIANMPYDYLTDKTNDSSVRWAINQLHILREEANIEAYLHAREGAYYPEKISMELARKTLELLQDLQDKGDFVRLLESGYIQKTVRESAEKEQKLFDDGHIILTGTNKYINKEEKPPVLPPGFFDRPPEKPYNISILYPVRLAEKLERERIKNPSA